MKTRRFDSFSLIELLVVVAVLLILVGILIPAILPMRERARRVECASNLRQLWIGANNYAMNNGGMPPSHSGQSYSTNNGWVLYDNGWVAFDKPTGSVNKVSYSGTNLSSVTTGSLMPYVGRTKVYACPTMVKLLSPGTNVFRSYAMNSYGGSGDACRRAVFVEMGIYKDANREFGNRMPVAQYSVFALENAFDDWEDRNGSVVTQPDKVHDGEFVGETNHPAINNGLPYEHTGAYHDGKGNIVFADGHVELISFTNTWTVWSGKWMPID